MSQTQIIYRSATTLDMTGIVSLINDVSGDDRSLEYNQFIVATLNNNIIGCIRTVQVEADCKEVASLVVLPEFRNRGIGSRLLTEILKHDKQRPLHLICTNDKQLFYEKNHFLLAPLDVLPATLKRDYLGMLKENNTFIVMVIK